MQLSNSEKQAATLAYRVAATQAEQDAMKQSNPEARATFATIAKRYRALANKFEDDCAPIWHARTKC